MTRKTLLVAFCFCTLTSCGQPPTDKELYEKIVAEICTCTQNDQVHKPSTIIDSCYKLNLKKNYNSLKKIGIDTITKVQQEKLHNIIITNEFRIYCSETQARLQKEAEEYFANRLTFKG